MNRALNREILRLSLPSILANLTVPIVGMVDTAVAGHLGGGNAAACIGAISIGSMLFTLLYWCFAFLRTGTGGLTAQAFGGGDMHGSARIFARGISLSVLIAIVVIVLQYPFVKLSLLVTDASAEVENLAMRYFFIRIWAAPATLGLMTFRGWFVGMQDSMSSMWTDLIINSVNVAASIILSTGIGGWDGLGFDGVALGTLVAQYCGLAFCLIVCAVKYRAKVFSTFHASELKGLLRGGEMRDFLKLNADLTGRSVFFIAIYIGYTMIAAEYGDLMLACSSILMQLMMLFSYFTDGFAYAGEALTGRFIGARDRGKLNESIRYVFVWSLSLSVLFIGVYAAVGMPLVRLMTDDASVVDGCRSFMGWLVLMPPLGCAAFTWDGIYMGATAAKHLRNSMAGAATFFFAVWICGKWLLQPTGAAAIHLLLGAYMAHLLSRTVYLTTVRSSIRIPT